MFTGIISHLGKVKSFKNSVLTIEAGRSLTKNLKRGSSIAVNGACLTVEKLGVQPLFTVEVMPETLKRTNLGDLKVGDLVNLELPLGAGSRIEGHFVQGHVDGVGKVKSIVREKNSHIFQIDITKALVRYIVEKGSIAVNGVSLTVIRVGPSNFSVGIIPYTFRNTNFSTLKVGDSVNIEVDILAKYVGTLLKKK